MGKSLVNALGKVYLGKNNAFPSIFQSVNRIQRSSKDRISSRLGPGASAAREGAWLPSILVPYQLYYYFLCARINSLGKFVEKGISKGIRK